MWRNPGGFATAFALSLVLAAPIADAQKSGGVLQMSHFDSPASMSMHEEATGAVNRPMMGVFNNLVIFDQHVKQNSLAAIVPDLVDELVVERGGDRVDAAVAPGRQMARRPGLHRRGREMHLGPADRPR